MHVTQNNKKLLGMTEIIMKLMRKEISSKFSSTLQEILNHPLCSLKQVFGQLLQEQKHSNSPHA